MVIYLDFVPLVIFFYGYHIGSASVSKMFFFVEIVPEKPFYLVGSRDGKWEITPVKWLDNLYGGIPQTAMPLN